jgi:hypothetical protein
MKALVAAVLQPHLGLALLNSQKQSQQPDREHEPGRGRQHRRHSAGNRMQPKTRSDAEEIQHRHPLELQALAHLDQSIEQHQRQRRSLGECGWHAYPPAAIGRFSLLGWADEPPHPGSRSADRWCWRSGRRPPTPRRPAARRLSQTGRRTAAPRTPTGFWSTAADGRLQTVDQPS